ncbi:hypothetical protein [Plantactinospora sp. KLBMP9567]|uniref:hypothetical protein n=1 Tax=Plantactinospora sp. KLBMP9567 TaxID=3085900 RepID=UPI0029824FBE|nr:hypothetical protein [Plantactinospora sp. KLBMP9567]MDW5327164.1 hypothetical protein [Plantactinospora sp. KLBMP9567]
MSPSDLVATVPLPAGEVKPAICRGFADRYSTQALQVIQRLFGFIEVDPPHEPEGRAGAPEAAAASSTD